MLSLAPAFTSIPIHAQLQQTWVPHYNNGNHIHVQLPPTNNFGWFLAGAVIGAAAALVLAPKSGKDTRKYLSKTSQESRDAMEMSGKELMDRGKDLYERGKKIAEEANELFERGRKLVKG